MWPSRSSNIQPVAYNGHTSISTVITVRGGGAGVSPAVRSLGGRGCHGGGGYCLHCAWWLCCWHWHSLPLTHSGCPFLQCARSWRRQWHTRVYPRHRHVHGRAGLLAALPQPRPESAHGRHGPVQRWLWSRWPGEPILSLITGVSLSPGYSHWMLKKALRPRGRGWQGASLVLGAGLVDGCGWLWRRGWSWGHGCLGGSIADNAVVMLFCSPFWHTVSQLSA